MSIELKFVAAFVWFVWTVGCMALGGFIANERAEYRATVKACEAMGGVYLSFEERCFRKDAEIAVKP